MSNVKLSQSHTNEIYMLQKRLLYQSTLRPVSGPLVQAQVPGGKTNIIRRPKSVPSKIYFAHLRTDKPTYNENICKRIQMLEFNEAHALNSLEPTFEIRHRSASHKKSAEKDEGETLVESPSYILTKNNQAFKAILKNDFFDVRYSKQNDEEDNITSKFPPFIKDYVDKLLKQIEDLQLCQEEERLNQKKSRIQASEHLKDQLSMQASKHEKVISMLKEEHEKEKANMRERFREELECEQLKFELIERRLKHEVDNLNGSLLSFKTNLEAEINNAFQQKLRENEAKNEIENQQKLELMQAELSKKLMREHRALIEEQQSEIDAMRKQQQSLFGTVGIDYSKSSKSSDKNSRGQRVEIVDVAALKDKVTKLEETNETLLQIIEKTEISLENKTNEFNNLQLSFDDKLRNIGNLYIDEIDELKKEIARMRLMYLDKSKELYEEKELMSGKLLEKARATTAKLSRTPRLPPPA